MRRSLIPLLIMFFVVCSNASADQVTLKNGDRVTGTIIKSDGKTIAFKSDLLGDVVIAIESVEAITTEKALHVTLADGRTVVGLLTTRNDKAEINAGSGVVSINRSEIALVRSEAEQQAYERILNPGWFEQWTGGADFGLALTKGNSDTTNFALGLAMTRQTLRDRTNIYAASIYNREKSLGFSRTTANTTRFGFRYDRDINRKWFGYIFTDLERNGQQALNLRLVPGGGLGYHAIRNERTQLDLLAGLALNREYFDGTSNDRSSLETQLGQTLSHRVSSRVSLKEQLFFFPNLSEGGEYRINFDAQLLTDITRRIGWQVTLSDRYLSNPPSGFKQNDLLLTTGIKVKLGGLK